MAKTCAVDARHDAKTGLVLPKTLAVQETKCPLEIDIVLVFQVLLDVLSTGIKSADMERPNDVLVELHLPDLPVVRQGGL